MKTFLHIRLQCFISDETTTTITTIHNNNILLYWQTTTTTSVCLGAKVCKRVSIMMAFIIELLLFTLLIDIYLHWVFACPRVCVCVCVLQLSVTKKKKEKL